MLSPLAPVVLLQHGGLDTLSGKTGLTLLRYRRGPVLAVVDPAHAGGSLAQITGIAREVPIVASLAEALPLLPTARGDRAEVAAVVGLAPSGGGCRRRYAPMWQRPWRRGCRWRATAAASTY